MQLTRAVNPFIGTIRNGNTFPGAAMPFGMVQWSPDTSAGGLSKPGGYNYGDLIIRGFSLTHLSGAGCAAFENVPFMPTLRPLVTPPLPNGSPYSDRFSHKDEQASPGYYAVGLASGIRVRLTVTARTGFATFVYPASPKASMIINTGSSAGATSNINGASDAAADVVGWNEVTGQATSGRFCGLHNRYTVYFAARFDRPFARFGTWAAAGMEPASRHSSGPSSGAFVTFDTRGNRVVRVKVGVSYVSIKNALLNLQTEDKGWRFGAVHSRAGATWNEMLNRIQATGGTPADKQVFYTALYHALLHPNVFSDANGQYMGFDERVHVASGYTQYANFSGWDIYRTEVQLLACLAPRETADMMQSLLADAQQGGWLPRWPVANDYTGEMNGDSADPIIADAYAFGARSFDVHAALHFMLKGAEQSGTGPGGYLERPNLAEYLQLGYVPPETSAYGGAATTLEYAVDDFAIAQLARALGDGATSTKYLARAENWRHLFNSATGFIEARTPHGAFPTTFNPQSMDGYVEGNAWQYTWMVPQNLSGLFHLMGGNQEVARRLDTFFTRLDAGPNAPYYWGGNEVGLEAPWEYDFAGKPWHTQAVVRRIETSLYAATPGGLPGNDDLGTLSAWYIWAAIGLYPEIPGAAGFALGSPLFPHLELALAAGHRLVINAPGADDKHPYVRSLRVDGHLHGSTWLPFSAVESGALLQFTMVRR